MYTTRFSVCAFGIAPSNGTCFVQGLKNGAVGSVAVAGVAAIGDDALCGAERVGELDVCESLGLRVSEESFTERGVWFLLGWHGKKDFIVHFQAPLESPTPYTTAALSAGGVGMTATTAGSWQMLTASGTTDTSGNLAISLSATATTGTPQVYFDDISISVVNPANPVVTWGELFQRRRERAEPEHQRGYGNKPRSGLGRAIRRCGQHDQRRDAGVHLRRGEPAEDGWRVLSDAYSGLEISGSWFIATSMRRLPR